LSEEKATRDLPACGFPCPQKFDVKVYISFQRASWKLGFFHPPEKKVESVKTEEKGFSENAFLKVEVGFRSEFKEVAVWGSGRQYSPR
jgi:hypothetical protein